MLRDRNETLNPLDVCWWSSTSANSTEIGKSVVSNFLASLSDFAESKSRIIEQFECWLFQNNNIILTEDSKIELIVGYNNNGLIFEIGSIDTNPLSSFAALRLFTKLLNPSGSPEAAQYLKVVSRLDQDVYLRSLKLDQFLASRLTYASIRHEFIRHYALQLLSILLTHIPQINLSSLLSSNMEAIQEFELWRDALHSGQTARHLIPAVRSKNISSTRRYLRIDRRMLSSKCDRSSTRCGDDTDTEYANKYILAASDISSPGPGSPDRRRSEEEFNFSSIQSDYLVHESSRTRFDRFGPSTIIRQSTEVSNLTNTFPSGSNLSDKFSSNDVKRFASLSPQRDGLRIHEVTLHSFGRSNNNNNNNDLNIKSLLSLSRRESDQMMSQRSDFDYLWHYIRIPAIFHPFRVVMRYRRQYTETPAAAICQTTSLKRSPSIAVYDDEDEDLTSFDLQQQINNGSQNATRSLIANSCLAFKKETDTNFDELKIPFCFEKSIHFPYHLSFVASIIFDYRSTIAEALSNPLSHESLSQTDVEDLTNMYEQHWYPHIRDYTERESENQMNCRLAEFTFQVKDCRRNLLQMCSTRLLKYEKIDDAVWDVKANFVSNESSKKSTSLLSGRKDQQGSRNNNHLPKTMFDEQTTPCCRDNNKFPGSSSDPLKMSDRRSNAMSQAASIEMNLISEDAASLETKHSEIFYIIEEDFSKGALDATPTLRWRQPKNHNSSLQNFSGCTSPMSYGNNKLTQNRCSLNATTNLAIPQLDTLYNKNGGQPSIFTLSDEPGSPGTKLEPAKTVFDSDDNDSVKWRNEYKIMSTGPNSCVVLVTVHLDVRFIYLISGDLLGESADVLTALWNLIYLCQVLSPYFSPINLPSAAASAIRQWNQERAMPQGCDEEMNHTFNIVES